MRKENQEIKLKRKDELIIIEKERNGLLLENKELEYKLKQQRLGLESEKLEIISQMNRLEADKISVNQALKSYENDLTYNQSLLQFQNGSKITELQRENEILKEEHRNNTQKLRQEFDKMVIELKLLHEREKDSLRNQISQLQSKLRIYSQEIEHLKQEHNQNMQKIQIEELTNELEYYKSLKVSSFQDEIEGSEEFRSIYTENFGSKDSYARYNKSARYQTEDATENLTLQKERLLIQMKKDKRAFENLRDAYEKLKQKSLETENSLKNEIKFLIGKLLKAKSKLSTEGELTGSIRRESMLSTLRYRSINQSQMFVKSVSNRNSE